ncbi:MAG: SUMF1/EgtB/PvdO family nonheme iron enzyme [Proteobacteria bacterium]|nr:SUMF1/EgtB/PvdO family nonheme iron enzyme [Pseudomonadota bacterium]
MAKKLALLIGNDTYDDLQLSPLNAPLTDVEDLKKILLNPDICQFDNVSVLPNPSLDKALREICLLFAKSSKDDLLLLYFTGHGVKDRSGELYFAIKETENDLLGGTAIPASSIKEMMNKSNSRRQVLILDCCHSGAFAKGFKGSEMPAITEDTFDVKGYGRAILTASNAVQYAADADKSEGQDHSLFTHYLIEGLQTGAGVKDSDNISVNQLYDYAHQSVLIAQPNMTPNIFCDRREGQLIIAKNVCHLFQLPEDLLEGLQNQDWRLRKWAVDALGELITEGRVEERAAALQTLSKYQSKERDRFVHKSMIEIINNTILAGKPVRKPSVATKQRQAGSVFQDTLKDGSKGPEMVVIPKGKFRMGDIQGNGCENEKPVHQINIKRSFALSRYPLTFDDYDVFVKDKGMERPDDEGWGRGNRPVINVSWEDAVAYVQWLSNETGKVYRLPSEAEWEYAVRVGAETAYWWGDEVGVNNANCDESGSKWSGKQTSPVDAFKANPLGLYDMSGNVWEWMQDNYYENYHGAPVDGSVWEDGGGTHLLVLRGGSWSDFPANVRSAFRTGFFPAFRSVTIGFRLALDL